jgi:adenylate cyclase
MTTPPMSRSDSSISAAARLKADARIAKTIGDAVMVDTSDAHQALKTGLTLLRAVEKEPQFPGVRIGVHYGPVVERSGDVFETTVNVAARASLMVIPT